MTSEEYSINYIFVYTDRKMMATFILIFFGMAQIMRDFSSWRKTLPKTK